MLFLLQIHSVLAFALQHQNQIFDILILLLFSITTNLYIYTMLSRLLMRFDSTLWFTWRWNSSVERFRQVNSSQVMLERYLNMMLATIEDGSWASIEMKMEQTVGCRRIQRSYKLELSVKVESTLSWSHTVCTGYTWRLSKIRYLHWEMEIVQTQWYTWR